MGYMYHSQSVTHFPVFHFPIKKILSFSDPGKKMQNETFFELRSISCCILIIQSCIPLCKNHIQRKWGKCMQGN